jgi:hypothetical protein
VHKTIKFFLKIALILPLCILLLSCSKISQKNFEKIKNNMTMDEVIAILGEPTNSENINIAGISGTSAVWKDNDAEIDIQFLNGHVIVKAYSKNTDSKDTEGEQ